MSIKKLKNGKTDAKKAAVKKAAVKKAVANKDTAKHPMLGKKCIIRTYSAGVHAGVVTYINPENSMECQLKDAFRIWRWENGGLSLSAIAKNGMKGGRVNKTDEIYLTNAIEYIPFSDKALASFYSFLEDVE